MASYRHLVPLRPIQPAATRRPVAFPRSPPGAAAVLCAQRAAGAHKTPAPRLVSHRQAPNTSKRQVRIFSPLLLSEPPLYWGSVAPAGHPQPKNKSRAGGWPAGARNKPCLVARAVPASSGRLTLRFATAQLLGTALPLVSPVGRFSPSCAPPAPPWSGFSRWLVALGCWGSPQKGPPAAGWSFHRLAGHRSPFCLSPVGRSQGWFAPPLEVGSPFPAPGHARPGGLPVGPARAEGLSPMRSPTRPPTPLPSALGRRPTALPSHGRGWFAPPIRGTPLFQVRRRPASWPDAPFPSFHTPDSGSPDPTLPPCVRSQIHPATRQLFAFPRALDTIPLYRYAP